MLYPVSQEFTDYRSNQKTKTERLRKRRFFATTMFSTSRKPKGSIQSWIRTFKDDPKILVLAAAQAQNAVNYILNQKAEPLPTDSVE